MSDNEKVDLTESEKVHILSTATTSSESPNMHPNSSRLADTSTGEDSGCVAKESHSVQEDIESQTEGVTDSPKKGPTLSTSTSSFEPLDPHDPNLSRLANTLFKKTSEYLVMELNSAQEDYELLTQMNNLAATKYSDMRQIANKVGKQVVELNDKYKKLMPVLDVITQLQNNITKLEEAAYKLDGYTRKLEERYKVLEKRYNATSGQ